MKKITLILCLFFLFVLSGLVFSSSSYISYARFNSGVDNRLYIDTDLTFNNAFSLTQGGNTIQNNGASCLGSATVGSTSSATWPSSGSNFGAVLGFPICRNSPSDCPTLPPATNSVSTNNQITFLSQSNFANALNAPPIMFQGNSLVSLFYNGLTAQTVNYLDTSSGQAYNNRQGKVGVYCTGKVRTSVTSPNGQTQVVDETDVTQPSNPNIQFTQNGQYTITTQMRNVQCIGAALKQPENDGYFYLYSYRQSPLTVNNLPSDTKVVTVQDSQISGQVSGSTAPASGSNIQLSPGESRMIIVPIQNTGNVPIMVTAVSLSYFGSPPDLTVAPSPTYPSPPCFLFCSSNFNTVIQPGQSLPVSVVLSAGPNFNSPKFIILTFTLTPTQRVCTQYQSAAVTVPYQVTPRPPQCPGSPNCPPPQADLSCAISPSSLTMAQNSFEIVGLSCTRGQQSVPCPANPTWTLAGVTGSITNPSNTGALIQVTSAPPASGTLTSTLSSGEACTASIAVTQNPPPSPFDCSILPSSFTFTQNQISNFGLSCSQAGSPILCPITPTWILAGLTGSMANPSAQGVTVQVTSAPPATGQLIAQFSPGHQCVSTLDVANAPVGSNCFINPILATLSQNVPQEFNLSCNQNGNIIPCSGVTWTNSGISGSFITQTNKNAVFISSSGVSQSGTINANVSGQFACSSLVSINNQINQTPPGGGGNISPGGGGNGCQVSPSSDVLVTGETKTYNVLCGQNLAPCTATWTVSGTGLNNQNVITNGQSVTVTASGVTGIYNGQISASCGQGCSCSSSISVVEAMCRYYT